MAIEIPVNISLNGLQTSHIRMKRQSVKRNSHSAGEIAQRKSEYIRQYHRIRSPGDLLASLGIFAWDSIEDLLLSSVAFPYVNIMLVGEAGGGKSVGARKILAATYGSQQIRKVDTHIENELSLGVCDVPDLKAGKMRTFFSDASIIRYKGIILDEFNRAAEELRRIYMPLLSERQVVGHTAQAITIIGTMNPLGDVYNTEPLDLAAAERFALVINVPEYHRVDESYRLSMLKSIQGTTSIDLDISFPEETIRAFRAALFATQLAYDEIESQVVKPLTKYTDAVLMGAQSANPPLRLQSTRTGKNLIRNILRLLAFRKAVYGEDPSQIIETVAHKSLSHVSVTELYEEAIPQEKINALHEKAKQHLTIRNALLGQIAMIQVPLEAISALLSKQADSIAEVDRNRLLEVQLDRLAKTLVAHCPLAETKPDLSSPWVYKSLAVITDCAIASLGLLNSRSRITDSALVKGAHLLSTVITPARTSLVPAEVHRSTHSRLLGDSLIERKLFERTLSLNYPVILNSTKSLNAYLSPMNSSFDQDRPSVPVPVGDLQRLLAFPILCVIVEAYLVWVCGIRAGQTHRDDPTGLWDPEKRAVLVQGVVSSRLKFWNASKERYDAES